MTAQYQRLGRGDRLLRGFSRRMPPDPGALIWGMAFSNNALLNNHYLDATHPFDTETVNAIMADAASGALTRASARVKTDASTQYPALDIYPLTGTIPPVTDSLVNLRLFIEPGYGANLSTATLTTYTPGAAANWTLPAYQINQRFMADVGTAAYIPDSGWYDIWWDTNDAVLNSGAAIDWNNIYFIRLVLGKYAGRATDLIICDANGLAFYEKPTKGSIAIFMDDGYDYEYTMAMYALSKAIPVTIAINPSTIGTAGKLTWAQVLALYAAGAGIANHGNTHAYYTTGQEQANLTNYDLGQAAIESHGINAGLRLAVLAGGWNGQAPACCLDGTLMDCFDICRVGPGCQPKTVQPLGRVELNSSYQCEFVSDAERNAFEALCDRAVANRTFECFFTHLNMAYDATRYARWQAAIDHLATLLPNLNVYTAADLAKMQAYDYGTANAAGQTAGQILSSAEIAAAVLDDADGIETGVTPRQSLRAMAAMLCGKTSGAGTGTETFPGIDSATPRVVVTTTPQGNRPAVTLSLT